jgi:hypothetical protein
VAFFLNLLIIYSPSKPITWHFEAGQARGSLWELGAAGKCDFCHFFGAPTSKNNEKSISRIIDFCLSSTFLRDFYRVRKIDRTFDLSSKHRFGFYGMRGNMYAYIVVKYVYPINLIVSSPGLQCRSSMDDILPFSLPSENLENDAFWEKTLFLRFESAELRL